MEPKRIRSALEVTQKLIPMMNNEEMNKLGELLLEVTERLLKEGHASELLEVSKSI